MVQPQDIRWTLNKYSPYVRVTGDNWTREHRCMPVHVSTQNYKWTCQSIITSILPKSHNKYMSWPAPPPGNMTPFFINIQFFLWLYDNGIGYQKWLSTRGLCCRVLENAKSGVFLRPLWLSYA